MDKALPSSVSPTLVTMAALFARIVPLKCVPDPRFTAPSTFQYTLHASAPLINFTFALDVVEKEPAI